LTQAAATQEAVILRESGVSSTQRPLDSITDASEYWIARFRGRRRPRVWHVRIHQTQPRLPATPGARVLLRTFRPEKIRGRGERRVPAAPVASCAKVESTRVSTADTPGHPAFPHAMVLTVSFALSLVTGLVCHHRRRNEAPLKPGWAKVPSAALTPASGRQDHTTSPSASHIIRPRAV
jgi:hypothetical protein